MTASRQAFVAVDCLVMAYAQMGVVVVDPRFIESDLATGQLVMPFPLRVALDSAYWLVWRPGREAARPVAAFVHGWQQKFRSLGKYPDDRIKTFRRSLCAVIVIEGWRLQSFFFSPIQPRWPKD
jgi:hypothetical protein